MALPPRGLEVLDLLLVHLQVHAVVALHHLHHAVLVQQLRTDLLHLRGLRVVMGNSKVFTVLSAQDACALRNAMQACLTASACVI